jgi:hypothetical protein
MCVDGFSDPRAARFSAHPCPLLPSQRVARRTQDPVTAGVVVADSLAGVTGSEAGAGPSWLSRKSNGCSQPPQRAACFSVSPSLMRRSLKADEARFIMRQIVARLTRSSSATWA